MNAPFYACRCSFCFFAVRVDARSQEMETYEEALLRELEWAEPETPNDPAEYGGRPPPTTLRPDLLDRLLEGHLRANAESG